jgi:hypothetical protein
VDRETEGVCAMGENPVDGEVEEEKLKGLWVERRHEIVYADV